MPHKYKLLTIIFIILAVPIISHAVGFPYWGDKGLVSCVGGDLNNGLNDAKNKLPICTSVCNLLTTAQMIIYFMMTLALFAIGPVMIAAGGTMMLVAAGSPERFSTGRKMATRALVGMAIALAAFVIVATFLWAIGNGTGTASIKAPWPTIKCQLGPANPQQELQQNQGLLPTQ